MVVVLGSAFGMESFIVGGREDELSRVSSCFLLWIVLEGDDAWCRLHVCLIVKHYDGIFVFCWTECDVLFRGCAQKSVKDELLQSRTACWSPASTIWYGLITVLFPASSVCYL